MKRIKRFFKKADPVTLALVALLGVSTVFASIQIVGTGGRNVSPATQMPGDELPVFSPSDIKAFGSSESFIAPVDTNDFKVTTTFFDETSDDHAVLASSIFFFQVGDSKYSYPSNGASFSDTNDDVVDVVAPLSGTISSVVDDDPVRGTIVTIEHEEGIKTILTGVYNVTVTAGETIEQGHALGVTGLSRLEADSGNVVHLEVIQSGNYLNPESIIGKDINDL